MVYRPLGAKTAAEYLQGQNYFPHKIKMLLAFFHYAYVGTEGERQ